MDPLHPVALSGLERSSQAQFRQAQQGPQGVADLVAHLGQEGALGLVRPLRHLSSPLQGRLGLLAVRHVEEDPQGAFLPAVLAGGGAQQEESGSLRGRELQGDPLPVPGGGDGAEGPQGKLRDPVPHHLLPGEPREVLEGVVAVPEESLKVQEVGRFGEGSQEGPKGALPTAAVPRGLVPQGGGEVPSPQEEHRTPSPEAREEPQAHREGHPLPGDQGGGGGGGALQQGLEVQGGPVGLVRRVEKVVEPAAPQLLSGDPHPPARRPVGPQHGAVGFQEEQQVLHQVQQGEGGRVPLGEQGGRGGSRTDPPGGAPGCPWGRAGRNGRPRRRGWRFPGAAGGARRGPPGGPAGPLPGGRPGAPRPVPPGGPARAAPPPRCRGPPGPAGAPGRAGAPQGRRGTGRAGTGSVPGVPCSGEEGISPGSGTS